MTVPRNKWLASSRSLGHRVFTTCGMKWFYADTGEDAWDPKAIEKHPCINCGKPTTNEGHDACIANLPGVKFACCGHGDPNVVGGGYIVFEDDRPTIYANREPIKFKEVLEELKNARK